MTSSLVPLPSPDTPPHTPKAKHQQQSRLDHNAPDAQHSPPLTDPEGEDEKGEELVQDKKEQTEAPAAAEEADLAADVREIVHLFQQRAGRRQRPRLPADEADAIVRRCDTSRAALIAALEHIRAHDLPTWRLLRHELRWEYCARTHTLCIRMPPSPFHESICYQVETAVDTRMQHAIETCATLTPDARCRALALWNENLQRTRSADASSRSNERGEDIPLLLSEKPSPDGSWRPHDSATPVAVLEVAWSEDADHWRNKCAEYIELDQHSAVRTVLGVKCDYLDPDNLRVPRARVLVYKRYEDEPAADGQDGVYGLDPWGPREVSGSHAFRLRLLDFVPWSTARTSVEIQQWSEQIGDVVFPLRAFASMVRHANLLRQPAAPAPAPTTTRVLGKRRRHPSEEPEVEEVGAEALASRSFISVDGETCVTDTGYRPTGTAAVKDNSTIPVRRRSSRLKRPKTGDGKD